MPSKAEWEANFPVPTSMTPGGVRAFYAQRGGWEQFVADMLGGQIPEPWGAEAPYCVTPQDILAYRLDQALARFEAAVGRLGEVIRAASGVGGAKKR